LRTVNAPVIAIAALLEVPLRLVAGELEKATAFLAGAFEEIRFAFATGF
jgi:hypothetical protein